MKKAFQESSLPFCFIFLIIIYIIGRTNGDFGLSYTKVLNLTCNDNGETSNLDTTRGLYLETFH